MSKPTVFISHITQEKEVACAVKSLLEDKFLGTINVFVSSHEESLQMGDDWMSTIKQSMIDCKLIIVICSPISVIRPWINFEAGAGWVKGIPVIPLCHSGLTPDKLPVPINSFQGGILNKKEDIAKLFNRIAALFGIRSPKSDDADFFTVVNSFERIMEKSAIYQDTIFINNLLSRQIEMLKYSIYASTLEYDDLKNIEISTKNIGDYSISFNSIYGLFNHSLLMIYSQKKIYEVFYENAHKLAENCRFILSYNNIQIAPDLKILLNRIIFSVGRLDDWFDNIAMHDRRPNPNEIKECDIGLIKSATPPFEKKRSNAINFFIDYYECLIYFQKWLVNFEAIINDILNQSR